MDNKELSMEDLLVDYDLKKIRMGDRLKGTVLSVNSKEAIVNINYMKDGIIARENYVAGFEGDLREIAKEGDKIEVIVKSLDDGEGNVILSKKEIDIEIVWENLKNSYEKDALLNVTVSEVVKGGVVCKINGIRAFIPASQLSINRVENLNEFVGKNLEVKVIEFDRSKGKVVLSRRVIEEKLREEKRNLLWSNLKSGEKKEGIVTRLAKFGAFVDIGGLEGLVHLSDLSWKRILNASEVVNVGDKVSVYVGDFDKEKNRLSLVLKDKDQNPWEMAQGKIEVGSIIEGKVTKFINIGAFVEIADGVEGLVHISEMSEERVVKPSDVVNIGDKVKVKVLDVNKDNKRISLSIKEAIEKPVEDFSEFVDDTMESSIGELFGDKLKGLKL